MTTLTPSEDKVARPCKLHKVKFAGAFAFAENDYPFYRAGTFTGKNFLARFFTDIRKPLERQYIALCSSKLTVFVRKS